MPNELDFDRTHEADELDLIALEERALQTWRDADDTEALADGFVDRLMQREDEAHPPLFAVETVAEPDPVPVRSWSLSRVAAGLAAAAGLAGLVTFANLSAEEESDGDEAAVAEIAGGGLQVDSMLPDRLGRPDLRRDGVPGAPLPEDLGAAIENYIADYGRDWGPAFEFHGTVLVARGGEVKYVKGFGVTDPSTSSPNAPDTRYRLGLMTEQFTAAAILQLRDVGMLSLHDRLSKYIPEFPRGHEITLEHLLEHTSGIPNYTDLPYFHTWKNQEHSTDQLVARFAPLELEFDPGTDFSPTNSGYYLLGAVIERVSGQPYGAYIEQNVFRPAGMHSSTFGDAYETGEQARGNVWNDEEILDPPDPIDMSVFGGAGGLVSTGPDLARWDKALYDGTVLARDSAEELIEPSEYGYGYGYVISEAYGQPVASFPGAIDGFNGHMLRFLEDQTLVVVLSNTEVVPGSQVAEAIAMIVYGDEPPPRIEPHEVVIAPATFNKYVGTYTLTDETKHKYGALLDPSRFALLERVHVRRYGDRLYFDVPGHGLSWMHPMGRNRFFFKDHAGNTLSFELGEDRKAHTLSVHYQDAEFQLRRQQ